MKYKFALAGVGLFMIPASIFSVTIAIAAQALSQKKTLKTIFQEGGFLGECESSNGDLVVAKDYVGRDENGRPVLVPAFMGVAKRLPEYALNQVTMISPVMHVGQGGDREDTAIRVMPNGDCYVVQSEWSRPYMASYRFGEMIIYGQIPAVPHLRPH